MFKKKQKSPSPVSPSFESLPEFFKSPTVPRFNSAFPPFQPNKKYRGVYERAGFEVYKGDYASHKHSHDPNHPSECTSMKSRSVSNTPSPAMKNFPRNFSAPNPFPQNGYQSEPNLSRSSNGNGGYDQDSLPPRHQNSSEVRSASARASAAAPASIHQHSRPNMKGSVSSASFNYVSLYSTPGVDSRADKDEQIKKNNFSTPVTEVFDRSAKAYQTTETSPQKSFHSLTEEYDGENEQSRNVDKYGGKGQDSNQYGDQYESNQYGDQYGDNGDQYDSNRNQYSNQYGNNQYGNSSGDVNGYSKSGNAYESGDSGNVYSKSGNAYDSGNAYGDAYESGNAYSKYENGQVNGYGDYENGYDNANSNPDHSNPYSNSNPDNSNSYSTKTLHAQDPLGLTRESVLKYQESGDYNRVPRLSELIEEEVGGAPSFVINDDADEDGMDEFHDASPVLGTKQTSDARMPEIVVDEDYDRRAASEDEDGDEQVVGRPTASTYISRDQLYELLTGGDLPTRTPDLKMMGNSFGRSTGPVEEEEEDFEANNTDPTTATNSYGDSDKKNIEDEIDSLTRDLHGSQLESKEVDPRLEEINKVLEDRFVHRKIVTPQLNLEALTEPLSISRRPAGEVQGPRSLNEDQTTLSSSKISEVESLPKLEPEIKYPSGSGPCRKCNLEIQGKSIWSKDGQLSGQWHRHCFSCHNCSTPFSKGTNCYVIRDFPYCEQHFHELNNSICGTCGTGIEGLCLENEKSEKFHPHCLSCFKCGLYIDKDYFIVDGLPLCETDGLIELEKEKNLFLGIGRSSRIEKRRTRLLQI